MKTIKRFLSMFLCIAVLVSAIPLSAIAVSQSETTVGMLVNGAEIIDTGNCGDGNYDSLKDNLTYTLYENGLLVIDGTGEMSDFTLSYSSFIPYQPWSEYRDQITSVYISDGVTSIGDYAFWGCCNLSEIQLGDTISSFGSDAFSSTEYVSNSANWDNSVLYIGNYLIDSNYSELPNKIIVKDGTKVIADRAFWDRDTLQTIVLPNSLKTIGVDVFSCADGLENIVFNGTVEEYCNVSFGSNLYFRSHNIYIDGSLATNVVIPEGVQNIQRAFDRCSSIVSVSIPSTVTNMGAAFNNCYSLKEVTIANGIKNVTGFTGCSSLKTISLPDSVETISGFSESGLQEITIGKGLKEVTGQTFHNCYNLEKVYYTGSVDDWCQISFSGFNCNGGRCSNPLYFGADLYIDNEKLTDVNIQEISPTLNANSFCGCGSIVNLKLNDSITEIGGGAFDGCNSLERVILPFNLKTIGGESFNSCYNLKTITIADKVNKVGTNAFAYCNIENLIIADNSTTISKKMVVAWSSLKNVYIPNSVTEIANGAFSNRTSITDVYFAGSETEWNQINIGTSNECLTNATIHFNSSSPEEPVFIDVRYGADRFTFGEDITGYVGDEIDSLVVYTSANENIASLDITSSNTDVVEIGTIEIGVGDYITSENEHMATIPLKLKAEGTSTITITSPEGISTSVLVVVYPKEVESEETNQYIQEHTSFVNSNKYSNLTTNASFYNSIWKHEENSSNFTRYAAWDVIGRVGKFAALDFYGAFETENPYDVVLVDTFRSYVNNEKSKAAEVFETTTKNILGSPGVFNDVLDVLKTSESWNSDLTQDWLQFTDNVQEDWIQGVFFTESTFDLDDYNPELYKVLKEVFSKTDKSGFEKVFKNIKNFGTITDYITSGGDVVFRFFDAYQKYLIAEALFETNEYMLASVEMIAEFQMTGENSELLLDALEPYWDACDYDSAFSSVCSIMLEDGLLGSTGNVAYTLLGKELLRDFVYAAIHKVTGLSLGALVATYNLTYICLDYLSGLGDLTETHKLMNAAALLEKEYIELAKDKAETLVAEKTHQAAAEFDTVWGFLQSLEGYCYKTMSAYVSAFKREYTTNYIIETAITKNPFFAVIDGIKLSEDLTSCDSAIQAVVYLESEWVNANCHKGIYSSSNLMTVKCPTDVYVYDSENNLVLSIIDNKVTFCADHITAFVDGDEKIFVLPTDQEYDVQITATGNGTMDYAVKSFDEIELLRTIRYDDVELVDGTSYAADVPSELYVEKENYNLKTEAGAQIEADYDSLAPENETLADISGTITCYGNDNDSVTIRLLQDANEIESVQITDNSYVFESVVSGTYTLEVSKANHVTRTYEITVSDEDVVQNVKIHLLGDVNGDGRVNTIDVNRVYAHVRETNPLTGYELKCANVAGSGDTVNTIDVNRIYAHVKETNLLW